MESLFGKLSNTNTKPFNTKLKINKIKNYVN
jgi:hypothetical protein